MPATKELAALHAMTEQHASCKNSREGKKEKRLETTPVFLDFPPLLSLSNPPRMEYLVVSRNPL